MGTDMSYGCHPECENAELRHFAGKTKRPDRLNNGFNRLFDPCVRRLLNNDSERHVKHSKAHLRIMPSL
jgi:hypothetical protein